MSARFDLALVVSKPTSCASSSGTVDSEADKITPMIWREPASAAHRESGGVKAVEERKRSADLARAFKASTSRSRGGALVTREPTKSRTAKATWSTARSKAA